MIPLPDSIASGTGSVASENVSWNHTIGNLGKTGLIVISWLGAETGGEQNPEEINQVTFNGVVCEIVREANRNETGAGMAILRGANIPPAGTYVVNLNFQDSPKQAERKRGVSAAFKYIKDQYPEAVNSGTFSGSPSSQGAPIPITPLTNNALVVGTFGQRTGLSFSWSGLTELVTNRADNGGGVSIAYLVVPTPATQNVNVFATNPEDCGLVLASFPFQRVSGGQIL